MAVDVMHGENVSLARSFLSPWQSRGAINNTDNTCCLLAEMAGTRRAGGGASGNEALVVM